MGQKTNPTLLRLEKTNQHYKGCWYSDRFYSQLLHSDYKTCVYFTKIFHKIHNINPLFFYKAGHQLNHLFCIFAKNRFSRHKSRKNFGLHSGIKKKKNNLSFMHALTRNLSTENQRRTHEKTLKVAFTSGMTRVHAHSFARAHMHVADSPYAVCPLLWAYLYKELQILVAFYESAKTSGYEMQGSLEEGYSNAHQDLQHAVSKHTAYENVLLEERSSSNILLAQKAFAPRLKNTIPREKSNYRARMESVIDLFLSKRVLLPKDVWDSYENKDHSKNFSREKSLNTYQKNLGMESFYSSTKADANYNGKFRNTQICFVKVNHAQQNAHFLSEKIANSIKKRLNYQRIRRQILWDVNQCSYIRGIRVILSGRVATLSKKAQKARTFSFQWGQTEVHVFSSLVQFTKMDVVTAFGKIGVKVWVCYTNKEIS